MGEEICCKGITDAGEYTHCEYDAAWCCRHPYANGFVLTSTLTGARPANCPKLKGNAISQEEKERREKEGKARGGSFRYGGLSHDYGASARDFGEERCFHCGRYFHTGEKPYCRVFPEGNGRARFGIICRGCAYGFGDGVVEMDGNTYYDANDFTEGNDDGH